MNSMKTNNTTIDQIILLLHSENQRQQLIITVMLIVIMVLVIWLAVYVSKYRSASLELAKIKFNRNPPPPLRRDKAGNVILPEPPPVSRPNNF